MSCLYILEINPLSVDSFTNIFSHSEGCLFILFMVSFAVQKLLSWGFPGDAVVENLPANAGDMGSSPGLGGSHMPQSEDRKSVV